MLPSSSALVCGPLLRYTYIDHTTDVWNGSILVVLRGSQSPSLNIRPALNESPSAMNLLSGRDYSFWRFSISVPLDDEDRDVSYEVRLPSVEGDAQTSSEGVQEKIYTFWVPGKEETMRILFHSCNGFSLGKETVFAGPVLWKDVMRVHSQQPLHVMIGGGDQVYSDAVRTKGPLKEWATDPSPRRKAKMPVSVSLKKELDEWYFQNYCEWYSTQPFAEAAAILPSLQIFDDHDIIDGYGSYPDRWMKAPVFLAIGKVAWKYYMLFQQHTPPQGERHEDPSWEIGTQKGPYIREPSRSISTSLGKRIAFYGLDCRVDRTLNRICYDSTYELMFKRLEKDVVEGRTNHLILLLGVPIAYPRLVWLENLLTTQTVALLHLMHKFFGIAGGLFNKFDGSAELLDDLNDHWCAGTHKEERNKLVQRLQGFAARKHVRITILSGDVHLACVGRFFSKASLNIPQNVDPRYMINVVSSAITNAPPPNAVANMLNKRNKLHHLDSQTDENLMAIFYQNPDGKGNNVNRTTLPSRNYCIITEHAGLTNTSADVGNVSSGVKEDEGNEKQGRHKKSFSVSKAKAAEDVPEGHMVAAYQQTGGIDHPSAQVPSSGTKRKYALDVCIRAEIDPKSDDGRTLGYGFSIPSLEN